MAGVFLKLSFGIDTVLLRNFVNFCQVMCMLTAECCSTVGTEGIETSEGIFEEDPLLLLGTHVFSIITLYVCETLTG